MALSLDTLTADLHSRGWSYGYTCVVTRDGQMKWIADARKGEHRAKAEGRTLAEALRKLRKLVEPLDGSDEREEGEDRNW